MAVEHGRNYGVRQDGNRTRIVTGTHLDPSEHSGARWLMPLGLVRRSSSATPASSQRPPLAINLRRIQGVGLVRRPLEQTDRRLRRVLRESLDDCPSRQQTGIVTR